MPFRYIKSKIALSKKLNLSSENRISLLRNSFKNKRCFVIGNGPSLKIDDLDRLSERGDVTIASNKIYLAFNETRWRPSIYTVADWCVAENNRDKIRSLDLYKLFPTELKPLLGSSKLGTTVFYKQYVPAHCSDEEYKSYFFHNLSEGAFVGETVTNLNIQIAAHLGCNPIYLIGVDGRYTVPQETTDHQHYGKVVVATGESNHFSADYRSPGETWSIPRISCHERNYEKCFTELAKRNVALANASRNSAIESLPKVDFDSLF